MEETITIKIEHFPEIAEFDQSQTYCAWIEDEKYKGLVVTSDSISGCVKEIAISLKVMELYKEKKNKKSPFFLP